MTAGAHAGLVLSLLVAPALSVGCTVDIHLGGADAGQGGLAEGPSDGAGTWLADGATTLGVAEEPDVRDVPRVLAPGLPWQWQISGTIDTTPDVAVFDLDLFDAPTATLDALHGAGRLVLCFFSAGTRENFRPDASLFDPDTVGNSVSGATGEAWLDIRADSVRSLMLRRLDLAAQKGCDGVQPSSGLDGSGFGLTAADEADYVRFLAREGHVRGLSVGLTNAVEIASAVEPDVDWVLNQGCLQYRECDKLAPFVTAAKAVLHVELVSDAADGTAQEAAICNAPERQAFSTILKTAELGVWRLACP